ncbi:MAG: hypothetical protein ACE5DY_03280 [Mariprofundaceae bacterium]
MVGIVYGGTKYTGKPKRQIKEIGVAGRRSPQSFCSHVSMRISVGSKVGRIRKQIPGVAGKMALGLTDKKNKQQHNSDIESWG